MKANEVDILIISDTDNACSDCWQTRWQTKLSTAKDVLLPDLNKPDLGKWADAIVEEAGKCARPIVIIAHSWAVTAVSHALSHISGKVCGGFFVCPPDADDSAVRGEKFAGFDSYIRESLPFPSIVIASRTDSSGNYEDAEKLAEQWHSLFMDAGESGHINAESGHGPWPEGLIVFSQFLANLPNPSEHQPVQEAEEKIAEAESASLKNEKDKLS